MILPQPSPAEAVDIVAITQLAVSYSEAVSRGEIDEAVLVYADDGVLRSAVSDDAVGRAAIAQLISSNVSGLDFVFQTTHLGLVRVDGDRATARFPITEWARRSADGRGIQFLGVYYDELQRTTEGWRFTSRFLAPLTMGRPEGLGGKIHSLNHLFPSM
jgi:ketosteroid isomerase-like protein